MALVCPAMAVPFVATVYQRYCPLVAPVAVRVSAAGPQDALPDTPGAVGSVLMMAVTAVRVLSHVPLLMAA